jgi:hypothetical protein
MIRLSTEETGLDRDSIFNQFRIKMSKVEMDNALDFLSSCWRLPQRLPMDWRLGMFSP